MLRDVRIAISVTSEVDKILEKIAEERGVQKSKLVETIVLQWLYERGYVKIYHFNFRDNVISLWDTVLGRIVDLEYKPDKRMLFCNYCKAYVCGHILTAKNHPDIKPKIIKWDIIIDEY